jgi:hypothetical protein
MAVEVQPESQWLDLRDRGTKLEEIQDLSNGELGERAEARWAAGEEGRLRWLDSCWRC